ncbi:MAG: hypothetical protein LBV69_02655, partial [Bacteroidales bacterium]|nr:hypothetical protein [Bacteroidales bacterium]
ILLNENATLLKEVEVSAKYDISKHFHKLLKKTNKIRNAKDTVVYYSVIIETELYELGQKEVFQGIIKQVYKKGGKGFPFKFNTYLCKINSYYSNIETEISPVSTMQLILDNFMFSDLIVWALKHEKSENFKILCSNRDSIIYRENNKRDTIINSDYWGFKRDINLNEDIYFTEYSIGYHINSYSKDTVNRSYEKIKYNSKNILYPTSIISLTEYLSLSNLAKKNKDKKTVKKLVRREYVETIAYPNLDLDLDINLLLDSPRQMIKKVKEKYPDYVFSTKE